MENPASNIVRRANALDISISRLCREAGVSRRWFEFFKQRTPKAVEAYLKIEERLDSLEKQKQAKNENHRVF